MADQIKPSFDLLGIQGVSESVRIATKRTFDGAAAFLSRVCLPGAEEFGLLLRDRISAWRARNATRILSYANQKLHELPEDGSALHPRLLHEAIDEGSWVDDDDIQRMWAGILISGLSPDGRSDENLFFATILKQLSTLQVKVLHLAVARSTKEVSPHGLPMAKCDELTIAELSAGVGEGDVYRLDRELDHLRELGLIGDGLSGGIAYSTGLVEISPTALALYLYVRAQGSKSSPVEYFGLSPGAAPA